MRGAQRDVAGDRQMREQIEALEDDADILAQLAQLRVLVRPTLWPATSIVPAWNASSPLMQRSSVALARAAAADERDDRCRRST